MKIDNDSFGSGDDEKRQKQNNIDTKQGAY